MQPFHDARELIGQKPYDNSFWVSPERLLAGEYPGDRIDEKTRMKLNALLDSGITFFVDLTEEGELVPYAHLLEQEAAQRKETAVHSRHPIRDSGVTTRERMVETLDAIDAAIEDGHCVYVHCWGGVGRTGTVVGCWLARHGGSGQDALTQVDRLWRDMSPAKVSRHPGCPHTSAQKWMVREWSETGSGGAPDHP